MRDIKCEQQYGGRIGILGTMKTMGAQTAAGVMVAMAGIAAHSPAATSILSWLKLVGLVSVAVLSAWVGGGVWCMAHANGSTHAMA